jgi:hypothetical protein
MEEQQSKPKRFQMPVWLKKMGLAGFLFFFIKGIFWLVAGFFGFSFFKDC